MNPNQLEQLLLLEQSGELSTRQRRQLDRELAASAQARKLQAELRGFAQSLPAITAQPVPDVAARIDARLRHAAKPAFVFRPVWKPALAAVAALALLLGVRSYHDTRIAPADPAAVETAAAEEVEWTDPLEAEFTELESLLLAISTEDSLEITEL